MRVKETMRTLAIAVLGLTISTLAEAQLSRVYVSEASGRDSAKCGDLKDPCQTLAHALTRAAAAAHVVLLDSGEYGPITITQSVKIEAAPGAHALIQAPGSAIQISAASSDIVVLRGLTLKGGQGVGVSVSTVGSLHVETCVITRFSIGIRFNPPNGLLFVKDTIVRNSGQGIWVISHPHPGNPKVSINHCRSEDNGQGFMFDHGTVAIRDSVATGNGGVGFGSVGPQGAGEARDVTLENCVSSNNGIGIYSSGGNAATGQATRIRVSNTSVTGNATGLVFGFGAELLSRLNNTVEGNAIDGTFSGTYLMK